MNHYKPKGPDFLVVGLEKSGTHWVTALLNAHPEISAFPYLPFHTELGKNKIGEVHLFDTLASLEFGNEDKFTRPFSDFLTKYNKIFADLASYEKLVSRQELYLMFIERYNEYCDKMRGAKRLVGESTPAYVFYLDFIDSFYSAIKKICIIRDPKDRVVSWHFNQLRKGRKSEMTISDEFAIEYCRKRIIQEYRALMDYRGHIHCLTYEALSADTAKVVEGVLQYLGAEMNGAIIAHMIKEGSFKNLVAKDTGSEGRERGEESLGSHYRKGIVDDWVNHLTKQQAEKIDNFLADLERRVFIKFNLS